MCTTHLRKNLQITGRRWDAGEASGSFCLWIMFQQSCANAVEEHGASRWQETHSENAASAGAWANGTQFYFNSYWNFIFMV